MVGGGRLLLTYLSDHHMAIESALALGVGGAVDMRPDLGDHGGAKGDVGHEVAIHLGAPQHANGQSHHGQAPFSCVCVCIFLPGLLLSVFMHGVWYALTVEGWRGEREDAWHGMPCRGKGKSKGNAQCQRESNRRPRPCSWHMLCLARRSRRIESRGLWLWVREPLCWDEWVTLCASAGDQGRLDKGVDDGGWSVLILSPTKGRQRKGRGSFGGRILRHRSLILSLQRLLHFLLLTSTDSLHRRPPLCHTEFIHVDVCEYSIIYSCSLEDSTRHP